MQIRTQAGTLMTGPSELILRMLAKGANSAVLRERHRTPGQGLQRKARVLAVVHGWLPTLAAGSERMMQHMLDALPQDEFEVRVLSLFGEGKDYTYEGTPVENGFSPSEAPDIIITHHGPAARVVQALSQDYPEARVVAVFHNERYDIPDILALNADLNVFNTHWVKKSLGRAGIVVHPPVEPERHIVDEIGGSVTLVNLQDNKGVNVFHDLVSRMPDVPFLGVEGTHGQQVYQRSHLNVDYMTPTQDMREVWKRTKVVLMPSEYESYGMVAAEACVNGIPVIANPTPGLVECLGDAGIFIPREHSDDYERAVHLLMTDAGHYQERSDRARLRGQELKAQTRKELVQFVKGMLRLK